MSATADVLKQESGGHRIQRVPPTERRGRIHTSTVTVAVLPHALVTASSQKVTTADVRTEWFSGTGAGGQHRNKCQNSVRLIHEPTGIVVTSQQRKRSQSFNTAWAELEQRVQDRSLIQSDAHLTQVRSDLVGSGMRADKIRTYRFQDDQVKDHQTGQAAKCSMVMRGRFDLLHSSN